MSNEKKQEKEDPDFKDVENGPMSQANRECRDVFCCIIFFANVLAMIYLTYYGYYNGEPYVIYRGTSGSQQCGRGDATDFPYMYLYNPIPYGGNIDLDKRVCVKKCPTINEATNVLSQIECFPVPTGGCSYTISFSANGTVQLNAIPTSAAFLGYPTTTQVGRVCIPTLAVFTAGFALVEVSSSVDISSVLQQGYLADFITDVSTNWMWLLLGVGFSIIFSFTYMFLLRCLVGCIVWGSILGIFVLLIGMGIIFLYNGGALTSAIDQIGYLGIPSLASSQYYNIYGYICFGVAVVLLIILICCCNRIRLAVAVCKSAGQFVVGVYLIILVPIVMTAISIMVWVACLVVMVYLVSAATFSVVPGDLFTAIADYTENTLLQFYYFMFATLWCNALIGSISTFVIASSCCMWYYSHGPGQDVDAPIARSYKMVFRFHFGSLAFGSFILALVQMLQIIVELFKKQSQASGVDRAPFFEYVMNCLRCCLACIERIVQFLNKTAYIQIALRGKNFCYAAHDGFEIVWSNGFRYAIVTGVGELVMFLGKLLISIGTTAAFYCLITFVEDIRAGFLEPLLQLLLLFVISFVVASIFMSVYSVAMDALLACFIVDQLNQKAKGGKGAVYGPEELADLMDTE